MAKTIFGILDDMGADLNANSKPPPTDHSSGRDSRESQEAFGKIAPAMAKAQASVLYLLQQRGDHGGTVSEFADHLGKELNAVSGRFSELAHDGRIRKTGRKREDSAVYVIVNRE